MGEGGGKIPRGRLSISPLVHSHIHLHAPSQRDRESEREPLIHKKKEKRRESSFIKAAQFHCAADRKAEERKLDLEVKQNWTPGKVHGSVGWDCTQHD